jgi:hypothetical protein
VVVVGQKKQRTEDRGSSFFPLSIPKNISQLSLGFNDLLLVVVVIIYRKIIRGKLKEEEEEHSTTT